MSQASSLKAFCSISNQAAGLLLHQDFPLGLAYINENILNTHTLNVTFALLLSDFNCVKTCFETDLCMRLIATYYLDKIKVGFL